MELGIENLMYSATPPDWPVSLNKLSTRMLLRAFPGAPHLPVCGELGSFYSSHEGWDSFFHPESVFELLVKVWDYLLAAQFAS